MTQDNQPINGHIKNYLNFYCGLYAPGFAVLLKGEWGCGKTWFIKRYIVKLQEQKQKCLYVNLNGVSSFSEIEQAFLLQQIPFLASKHVAIGSSIIAQVISNHFKIDVSKGKALNSAIPSPSLTEYVTNLTKSILIFDELERCQIDLNKILGYISNFVEHQELKVIIIANEEKLDEKSDYKVIKEKVIEKTFTINIDFNGALENFIKEVNNSKVRDFLFENINLIEKVYIEAKYNNLRTLSHIVLDFEIIFESLPEKARAKSEILQDILKVLIVLSIEIKSGRLSPEDIYKLQQEYISSLSEQIVDRQLSSPGVSSKEKTDSPQSIFQKYHFINFYTLFPSYIWWGTFFDKGILDAQELEKSIKSSKYFEDETTPDWVKLWHYPSLSDEDFEKLLTQVESEYTNRYFDDPGVVKHITGMFLNFSDAGLLHKSSEEILKDSKLYIDWFKNNEPSKLASYSFYSADNGYLRLGFKGAKFEEFKEFCTYLEKGQESVKNDNMPNIGQELLSVMESDVWKFRDMICLIDSPNQVAVSQQYHRIPVLKHITEVDFLEKLLSLKFEDQRNVCNSLVKRYEIETFNKELFEELDWLKCVHSLLLEEITRKQGKVSSLTLKSYIEPILNEAINKLEGVTH
ncbi:MAG: P-loop NTPase fold protein [Nostoc sp.]|uniref:P-loop NTPase fold protein n=1 Tax=Nostoc sp. TaxID=1180 RepID=UPI002FF79085